jgi:phage terminase small subunit
MSKQKTKPTSKPSRAVLARWNRFADEYIIDLNATQAYKRAGYNPKSPKVAQVNSAQLLSKPMMQQIIEEKQRKLQAKYDITVENVLKELSSVGFSKMNEFVQFGPDGVVLRDSRDLTQAQLAAIAEVSETTTKDGGSIKFKLHDKLEALKKLGEHLGLFNELGDKNNPVKVVLEFLHAE